MQYTFLNILLGKYHFSLKFDNNYIENYGSDKILLLPYYYFEPCIGENCEITDDTIIIHKHELSWLNEDQKKIFNYLSKINLLYVIILIIVIILAICLIIKYK